MPRLEIKVVGDSTICRHAERGVLSIAVASQGPSQETVSQDVTSSSNHLRTIFQALAPKTASGDATPDAPITIFSMTGLSTQTWIPQDRDCNPLPRLYSVSTSFRVIFCDFDKLADVASTLLITPHVSIENTTWRLTDDTYASLASESREMAMRDAVQKAEDFADVIGREVLAVEIKHLGLSARPRTKQSAREMGEPPLGAALIGRLALEPEDVELSSSVEVVFVGE